MKILSTVGLFLFLVIFANGQALSPKELIEIHHAKQISEVTAKLSSIGYHVLNNQNFDEDKLNSWYFQYHSGAGDTNDFAVYREDRAGKVETSFMISNIYNYHRFIKTLAEEKYKLEGAAVINFKSHLVFSKKKMFFLVSEQYSEGNEPFYVVSLQNESTP